MAVGLALGEFLSEQHVAVIFQIGSSIFQNIIRIYAFSKYKCKEGLNAGNCDCLVVSTAMLEEQLIPTTCSCAFG